MVVARMIATTKKSVEGDKGCEWGDGGKTIFYFFSLCNGSMP